MDGIKIDLPLEGGGGGSIDTLTDVDLTNLEDGYTLVWNEITQLWEANANTGGYSDNQAQDAVGDVLTDTSTVDLKWNTITRELTADVLSDGITIQTGSSGLEVKSGVFAPTVHSHSEYLLETDFETIIDGYLTEADLPACLIVESELTTCLSGYSTTSHTHTGVYSPVNHTHTGTYEPANANIQSHISCADIHCPSSTFALVGHNHTGIYQPVGSYALNCDLVCYSLTSHNHTGVYQPVGDYVVTCDLTTCLSGYSTTSHNHDLTYAPISHDHSQYALACDSFLVCLDDVTIITPTNKQVLAWDCTTNKWTNQTNGLGDGNVCGPVSAIDGAIPLFDGKTGCILKDSGCLTSCFAPTVHTHTHDSTTSISGGMTSNYNHFSVFATVAAIEAASSPSGIAYVEEKQAYYFYCDDCSISRDGDLVLNTPLGGTTRWQMLQKVSRKLGETGWVDRDDIIISKYSSTTIRATTSSTSVYAIKGIRYELVANTYDLVISGSSGLKYIYLDSAKILKSRDTFWDFEAETPVAIIYWSGTAIVGIQTELHGIRDIVWHNWAHQYIGTQYKTGLEFFGSVQPDNNVDPGVDSAYNLYFTSGTIVDEDTEITINNTGQWSQTLGTNLTSDPGVFTYFYWNGSAITSLAAMADKTPFIYSGINGTPQWESSGILTDSVTGDYIVYHYFASPLIEGQAVYARPHNAKFSSLSSALQARPNQLTWSNYAEIKHLYTAVFRVNTGWATTHRAKLLSLQSFRLVAGTPISGVSATDHQSLSNRDAFGAHPLTAIDSGVTPNSIIKVASTGALMESGVLIDSNNSIKPVVGNCTCPSILWNTNDGIFSSGVCSLDFVTNGTRRLYITNTGFNSSVPGLFPAGTATLPGITFRTPDYTSGVFLPAAGCVGITACCIPNLLVSPSGVSINCGANLFQLPTTKGSAGQVLCSDGTGLTSWCTPGSYEPANANIQSHISTADIHCPSACFATSTHNHTGTYEPANANIQSHISCSDIHCPSSTFALSSHSHTQYALECNRLLTNLCDVCITAVANNEVLGWDCTTSKWTNRAAGTGSGDVVGPSSSTCNNIVLFDGTTGKLIKDSGIASTSLVSTSCVNQFTKQQYFTNATLTDGANIAWDLDVAPMATVTLAGNRTLDNPTNMRNGNTFILIVKQDGTGSRTLAYGNAYKWAGGVAPVLSTALNSVDIISFVSDGTSMYGVLQNNFTTGNTGLPGISTFNGITCATQLLAVCQTGSSYCWTSSGCTHTLTVPTSSSTFADGTAAAPSITFTSDVDTGIYRIGSNSLGITQGGNARLQIDANGITSINGVIMGTDGINSNPSFTFANDLNTGIYRSASDELAFSAGGLARMYINVNGPTTGSSDGSPQMRNGASCSSPGYTFYNDSDTGVYRDSANVLGITAGGTALTISSTAITTNSSQELIMSNWIKVSNNIAITDTGAIARRLINKTGATSVAGQVVKIGSAGNSYVVQDVSSTAYIFGVVITPSVSDGGYVWVATSGRAQVLIEDSTSVTFGDWIRLSVDGRGATKTDRSTEYFKQIGYALESASSGTDVKAWVELKLL
jgi:hypothetical protein